jgi:sugar phosphate isomerase/epimerase
LAACDQIGERLANVHFSDLRPNPGAGAPPAARPGLGRRIGTAWQATHTLFAHHQMPGPGGLPLDALLLHLVQTGYAGPITMEINPFALRAWQPGRVPARLETLVSIVAAAQPAGSPSIIRSKERRS